jgi:hypothetical protein
MNLRLLALKLPIPNFIKMKQLDELFQLTAHAFGCTAPERSGRSYKERLRAYALFTSHEAEKCLRQGKKLGEVEKRLFLAACRLGQDISRKFCLRSPDEIMNISKILYRFLGIDFEGKPDGEVTIRRCFFSDYYTPQICRLISALDEGLASGLSGGGRLSFSQRITEEKDCCIARLVMPEKKS